MAKPDQDWPRKMSPSVPGVVMAPKMLQVEGHSVNIDLELSPSRCLVQSARSVCGPCLMGSCIRSCWSHHSVCGAGNPGKEERCTSRIARGWMKLPYQSMLEEIGVQVKREIWGRAGAAGRNELETKHG